MPYNVKKREYMREYMRKYRQCNSNFIEGRKIYIRRYAQQNSEKVGRYSIEYRRKNPEVSRKANRKYYRKNKAAKKANAAKYRAAKLCRIPKWLTEAQLQQIKDFYVNCPGGMVVDHIYPLQGKYVSGLHHPDNLQYLTRSENCHKSNKMAEVL